MQQKFGVLMAVLMAGLLVSPAVGDTTVVAGPSTDPWLGFMNVFELPENGGGFVFGQPWAPPDLFSEFDDPNNKVTVGATGIGDPNEFWYQGEGVSPGGPGVPGNKTMEATLYIEFAPGEFAGETMTFEGTVLSNTLSAQAATIFIKDFAPDFSSSFSTVIPAVPGPFSLELALDPGAGRHVQYGFINTGPNVWPTDVEGAGNVMYATPEPASLVLLGLGGLVALRRRRRT